MLICKNAEELDAMTSQPSASSVCIFFCCVTLHKSTTTHVEISVYCYWDTLDALSGANPETYAPAIKGALPVIKMAEEPWTCRRISILRFYGEQHDPASTCGNCDVCFAENSELSHTIDIRQDVERIEGLFGAAKPHDFVTRTTLRREFGSSLHHHRVVEYLTFKGVLKEDLYMAHGQLRCRLMMVGSN